MSSEEHNNISKMRGSNERWQRETENPNPFNSEKFVPRRRFGDMKQNSRWKRDDSDSNKKEGDSNRAYRPPRQRDRQGRYKRGRERFYSRRRNAESEKPKPKPFVLEENNFPSLGDNVKIAPKHDGDWHAAALKGKDLPQPVYKKNEGNDAHFIPKRADVLDDEIDWSDEERKPDLNSIDRFDETEYDSGLDDTDAYL